MAKCVFYFEFSNNFEVDDMDDIECVYYGFNMDVPDDKSEDGYYFFNTEFDESYDEFLDNMEGEFGTHDWSSSPHDDVLGVGYSAYEAPFKTIPTIMEKWREYFESRPDVDNVTAVVHVDKTLDEVMNMNDKDFYDYIAESVK